MDEEIERGDVLECRLIRAVVGMGCLDVKYLLEGGGCSDGDAQDEVNVIAQEGAHDKSKYASGEGKH